MAQRLLGGMRIRVISVASEPNVNSGKVYLIGAGPGDPDLLTLKAARALAHADVVLIDDLANRAVLQHCRADVRVIEVGKRGGCRSTPQQFIEKLTLRYARQGRIVARVKGGDPFVFGRGGEEMRALREAGVAVEAISGITAGIGVPAALGIPVTHRDCAPGVTLVTGHLREDGSPGRAPNWAALANSRTTLVIYMGMRKLESIAQALVAGGLPADTPACAIQDGTLSTQRCVVSHLEDLAQRVLDEGLGSPAIVIVGEVIGLADELVQIAPLQRVA